MTKRKARAIARAAVHISRDGKRGRPKGWLPQYVVWIGAGENGVCIESTVFLTHAKSTAEGAVDVIAGLLMGDKPRKHDHRGWLDERKRRAKR